MINNTSLCGVDMKLRDEMKGGGGFRLS